MPPRTANWPTSSTKETSSKPRASKLPDEGGEVPLFAGGKGEPKLRKGRGDRASLLDRPGRRHEKPRPPAEESLQSLYAKAADFEVGLLRLVGEGFTLGIEEGLAGA